jgi:nucleotide-binding universal stress UspA family protein
MEIRTILHPTDFSDSARPAFERALYVARKAEAELQLMHVTETFGSDPIRGAFDARIDEQAFYTTMFARADEQMKRLQGEAEEKGVRAKRIHAHGQIPSQAILDYAADQKPDLIIMGTHGRRGFRRMVAGSVAMEIVRRADAPVMTVPSRSREPWDRPVSRMMVPVDFSMHARTALECAMSLAHRFGAHLHILHVIEKPVFPAFYDASVEMMFGNMKSMLDEAAAELARVVRDLDGPEVPFSIEVVQGHAIEAILDVASAQAVDLVVLSTHGLTGVSKFFLGSVSERVIRMASISTLRIRTVAAPDARSIEAEAANENDDTNE